MDPFRWNDISNWQGAGYHVAGPIVAKCGEGLAFTDSTYAGFCAQAAAGGWPAYAYYALHTSQTADQARRAASIAGNRPSMFDTEVWPAESGSPAGIASLAELLTAVDTYRAAGGVMHVCYLPRSQWARMGQPDLTPLSSRGIRTINADYRAGAIWPGHPAWDAYGGVAPWGVQYGPETNAAYCTAYDWQAVWTGAPVDPPAPAPAPVATYSVHAGDTFSGIAQRFAIDLRDLERLNPGAGHPAGHYDLIYPGDIITLIGNPSPTPTPPPRPALGTYTVRAGDNLSAIAQNHGMTLTAIERLNPHAGHPAGNFNTIWPGDHLAVTH